MKTRRRKKKQIGSTSLDDAGTDAESTTSSDLKVKNSHYDPDNATVCETAAIKQEPLMHDALSSLVKEEPGENIHVSSKDDVDSIHGNDASKDAVASKKRSQSGSSDRCCKKGRVVKAEEDTQPSEPPVTSTKLESPKTEYVDSSRFTSDIKERGTAPDEETAVTAKADESGCKPAVSEVCNPVVEPRVPTGEKFVGAHVSIVGGLWNAVNNCLEIKGKAFGLFLRSQRTWKCNELADDVVDMFKKTLQESGISPWMVVPHGSYLMNCGSVDDELLQKSRDTLVDELQRCERLGLPIYNFHPGSAKGESNRSECIKKIAETINYVHSRTSSVITVIENMSCQGNTIGGKFSELRQIIDLITDKSRIAVCFDTCHAFAAGYDIRSEKGYEQTKSEFEAVIGRQYLKAVHLNDSEGPLGCHRDRHANIGKGRLGIETFRRIMKDPFFSDVPMILETPEGHYKKEIATLYRLQKVKS